MSLRRPVAAASLPAGVAARGAPAYFLFDLVEELNRTLILRTSVGVTPWCRAVPSSDADKILFYANAVRIPASRQIALELVETVVLARWPPLSGQIF